MGDGGRSATLVPRLSHIVRWHDFNGYGFNLHAEKGKAGQFIGKVDPGSPAEAAGLKQGDRIVEVNGINIGNENHQQVVRRIKAGGDETRLLVVDLETDEHYKEEKMVIRGDLPEVRFMTAVRDGQSEIETSEAEAAVISSVVAAANNTETAPAVHQQDDHSQHPVRLCKLCKWADFDGYGFNLHAEKEKPGQFIGSVDPASPAETGGLREGDRIIEVNGDNIETQTHTVVIQKVKAGGDRTELLVVDRSADSYYKARNITVSSAMAGVVVISTPPRMSDVEVVNGQSLEQEAQPVNNDESPAPPAPEEEATSGTVEITKTEEAEVTQTEEAEVTQTEEAEVPKYEIEVVKTEVEEIAVSEQTAEETDTVAAVMAPVLESPPPPAAVVEDAEETVPNGTPEVVVEHEMATGEAVVTVVADEVPAAELEDKTLEEEFNTYEQVEVTAPVSTESDHQEDLGRTTSNGINGGSVEPEHVEPEPSPVIVTKVEEPEPAVIRSTTTTTTNTKPAAVDGDLNLHLSAAEMKERLKSRKKQDPRLQKTSFEAKHKMFERM